MIQVSFFATPPSFERRVMPDQFASYSEAMRYLFTLTDYERGLNLKPRTTPKLGLERMAKLLESVGNPERRLRAVHVAGTKGKGSTSAMVANALSAAGNRVGLFIKPHVEDIRERIQVNGQWIPEDAVVRQLNRMYDYMRRCETKEEGLYSPTFFEAYMAVAFMYYESEDLDFTVIEVGMGGRLDATNVLQPLVCAITPVSMDHMERLGNTLEAIAGEKAGIIKEGVPVVCGPQQPEALQVIRNKCREKNARLLVFGEDFTVAPSARGLNVTTWNGSLENVRLAMPGRHQHANAATAVAILALMREMGVAKLTDDQIRDGIAATALPARVELVRRRPPTVVDAAHNPASIEALLAALKAEFKFDRLICVFAVNREKDADAILRLLAQDASHVIFTTMKSSHPCPPEELAEMMKKIGPQAITVEHDLRTAIRRAESLAGPNGLICVCGSFYLAGDARKLLKDAEKKRKVKAGHRTKRT